MKKTMLLISVFCIAFPIFIAPIKVEAETIRELQAALDKMEAELKDNENKKNLTQEQINSINRNVGAIRNNIADIEDDIIRLNAEIVALNDDIEKTDEQIKDVMNFVQISNGESMYLEYAFGAQSFTDFIYRFAVAEQLANYNSNLIDKYSQMIKDNEQKTKEQEKKKEEQQRKQEELAKELDKLNRDLIKLKDSHVSIEDEIKAQRELIETYKSKGCDLDQDIRTCGNAVLPINTEFFRPLISGYVTSEYGNRCVTYPNGVTDCGGHSGIDFSTTEQNAKVYAAGTGLVTTIFERNKCGGNMVFVQHKTKTGRTYTTAYYHLRAIHVKRGDIVTKDTVIGIMGGDPNREWWDECSTGAHIHVSTANGLYQTDYTSWSTFVSKLFNPRQLINAPASRYTWFTDRRTKFD